MNVKLYKILEKHVAESGYIATLKYIKQLNIPLTHKKAIIKILETYFHPFP